MSAEQERAAVTVLHPVHGAFRSTSSDKLTAMREAARAWGLQWSELCRECTLQKEAPSGHGQRGR